MKRSNVNMKEKISLLCLGILISDYREVEQTSFTMCEEYAETGNTIILLLDNDTIIDNNKKVN